MELTKYNPLFASHFLEKIDPIAWNIPRERELIVQAVWIKGFAHSLVMIKELCKNNLNE